VNRTHAKDTHPGGTSAPWSDPKHWLDFARAFSLVAFATAVSLILRAQVATANLTTLYLLAVVAVAVRCPRRVAVTASIVSVAAFDFFCVPPYYTLGVADYEYLITLGGMLAVALVISTQTARIRAQAVEAARREVRTEAMYRLSRRLADQTRVFEIACSAAEVAEELFYATAVILLPENGKITLRRRTTNALPLGRAEEDIAQWVFMRGERAGIGTRNYPESAALFVPLKGARETVGVLGMLPRGRAVEFSKEETSLLEVFASQTALAMERVKSHNAAEIARLQMQTEEMRSSLLSAVSHDLRTPLASITGAATTLRAQGEKLPPETRDELLDSIADEADRLGRLVSNLLDMTRLESGVELRRDYHPLEEIVGSALQRFEKQLAHTEILVDLPEGLPMVFVDDVLLGQVLQNLIENVLKYSVIRKIEIAAEHQENTIILEIRDRGQGFRSGEETRVFEKFYRGKNAGAAGAGLGLAICRAIIQAHKGTIEAASRPGGGAIVRIRLPIEESL